MRFVVALWGDDPLPNRPVGRGHFRYRSQRSWDSERGADGTGTHPICLPIEPLRSRWTARAPLPEQHRRTVR